MPMIVISPGIYMFTYWLCGSKAAFAASIAYIIGLIIGLVYMWGLERRSR